MKIANNNIETAINVCKSVTQKKDEADFYKENGLVVFTAAFLSKRGYCCKNSCRHCPYGFKNKK